MNTDADTLQARDDYFIGRFQAMASPCEILMDVQEESEARRLLDLAHAEARRIESKFSRYRDDNIIYKLNHAQGNPVEVDAETEKWALVALQRMLDLPGLGATKAAKD